VTLDADTWKTIISAFSAVIAVSSAALAYRSKVQTRTDIFESQRDALVLAMANNDSRSENLRLQSAIARDELERLLCALKEEKTKNQAREFLQNLARIENLKTILGQREYDSSSLDALPYTENNLKSLRRMARGEQVNAAQLSAETFNLVFGHIRSFVAKHGGQT
jgi:hypothetical protein